VRTAKQATLWESWGRAVTEAGVGHIRRKDLRDTFASQLFTCGVQLGWVSRQLGHADFGVMVRHYAKWCGDDQYRTPLSIEPGARCLATCSRDLAGPTKVP
jgi:integrase